MMDKKRFSDLLEKHLNRHLSDEEMDELLALMEVIDLEEQQRLFDTDTIGSSRKTIIQPDRKKILLKRIEIGIHPYLRQRNAIKRLLYSPLSAVAAVLAVLFSVGYWWASNPAHVSVQQASTRKHQQPNFDIFLSADSLPRLSLPNGDISILAQDDRSSLEKIGVKILRDEMGNPYYQLQAVTNNKNTLKEPLVFTSPRGGVSKIVLEDGTAIWLNSASSLEYPSTFSHSERRVTLHGEAYFDVAHVASKPFLVRTKDATIRVLGTAFNVSAYEDDARMVTTLLRGSVKLSGEKQGFLLQPGEQVVADRRNGTMEKNRVNVDDFTTWKDGYFNFSNQTVPEILQSIRRWYDIDHIEYQIQTEERFTGTFRQSKSLRSLLTKLEKISNVKFQIKEGRVVVMKK